MNVLSLFASSDQQENADDPTLLPASLRDVYARPHKLIGLDMYNTNKEAQIAQLREVFRKSCLSLVHELTGLSKSRLNAQQLNLAYHLIRGTVPYSAKYIADNLDSDPFLANFEAEHILPILRPINVSTAQDTVNNKKSATTTTGEDSERQSTYRDYRGFRQFGIKFVEAKNKKYIFDVHYAMRRFVVEKSMDDFVTFNDEIEKDLLLVPELPMSRLFKESLGPELAEYVMRIHTTLADRHLFSPQLLRFCNIDFERVQSEEEGAMVALLDSGDELPMGSRWHIVEEGWLSKWRTYVSSRGPRRYFPPGPIRNDRLMDHLMRDQRRKEEKLKAMLAAAALENASAADHHVHVSSGIHRHSSGSMASIVLQTQALLLTAAASQPPSKPLSSTTPSMKSSTGMTTSDSAVSDNSVSRESHGGSHSRKDQLKCGVHYRCVNFNVWRFFQRVHGGGPNICRETKDIYSSKVFSAYDAVVVVQCMIRCHQSRAALARLQTQALFSTRPGKQVMAEKRRNEIDEQALTLLNTRKQERIQRLLENATKFTQTLWREKKQLKNDDEQLKAKQLEQQVFAKAHKYLRDVPQFATGGGIIVKESQPIVHIGNTNRYTRRLRDVEDGIPFKIIQKPGTQCVMISSAKNESVFFKGSIIVSINHQPTNTMSYLEAKAHLQSATFPVHLELEKLYSKRNLPILSELAFWDAHLRFQAKSRSRRTAEEDVRRLLHSPSAQWSAHGSSANLLDEHHHHHNSDEEGNAAKEGMCTGRVEDEDNDCEHLHDSDDDDEEDGDEHRRAMSSPGELGASVSHRETHSPLILRTPSVLDRQVSQSSTISERTAREPVRSASVNRLSWPKRTPEGEVSSKSRRGQSTSEDEKLLYNMFKLALVRGARLIKHSYHSQRSHFSLLRITNQYLFYQTMKSEEDVFQENHAMSGVSSTKAKALADEKNANKQSIEDDDESAMQWMRFSLYQIKYIREGKDSKLAVSKGLPLTHCFELEIESKGPLLFQFAPNSLLNPFLIEQLNKQHAVNMRSIPRSNAANLLFANIFRVPEGDVEAIGAKLKVFEQLLESAVQEASPVLLAEDTGAPRGLHNPSPSSAADANENKAKESSPAAGPERHSDKDKGKEKDNEKGNEETKGKNAIPAKAAPAPVSAGGSSEGNMRLAHLLFQELRFAVREDHQLWEWMKKAKHVQLERIRYEADEQRNSSYGYDATGSKSTKGFRASTLKAFRAASKALSFLTSSHQHLGLDPIPGEWPVCIIDTNRILHGHLPEDYLTHKCDFTINNFQKLIDEIRGSQVFVHKSGMPIKRLHPKVAMRRIDE